MKYTFRGLNESDQKRIDAWVKADPDHATGDSTFFYAPRVGVAHVAMEHDNKPVFYCTVENIARVHIQFNPQGSPIANVKALIPGLRWLLNMLKERGYHELVFNSRYAPLIKLFHKLGFTKNEQDYASRLI